MGNAITKTTIECKECGEDVRVSVFENEAVCRKCGETFQYSNLEVAESLRRASRGNRRDAEESSQRCDTDGFVSQWASGVMASLYDMAADLAEAGNVSEFFVLMEGDRKVDAKMIHGRFGLVWKLEDSEAEYFGRRFVPVVTGKYSRVQRDLGLHEDKEERDALVILSGSGTGLSGTAYPIIIERTY